MSDKALRDWFVLTVSEMLKTPAAEVTSYGDAVDTALARVGPPPVDHALLLAVAEAVRDKIAAEVSRSEDGLRKAHRRQAATEMQIILKFCAMHCSLPDIVADVVAHREMKTR